MDRECLDHACIDAHTDLDLLFALMKGVSNI